MVVDTQKGNFKPTDNFCLFLHQQTDKRQMTNFRLDDEQTVNGFKKKTPGLPFSFWNGSLYMYIYIYVNNIYRYGKRTFDFLGRQKTSGNTFAVALQQTCPSTQLNPDIITKSASAIVSNYSNFLVPYFYTVQLSFVLPFQSSTPSKEKRVRFNHVSTQVPMIVFVMYWALPYSGPTCSFGYAFNLRIRIQPI